jgi:hypothetical protein
MKANFGIFVHSEFRSLWRWYITSNKIVYFLEIIHRPIIGTNTID